MSAQSTHNAIVHLVSAYGEALAEMERAHVLALAQRDAKHAARVAELEAKNRELEKENELAVKRIVDSDHLGFEAADERDRYKKDVAELRASLDAARMDLELIFRLCDLDDAKIDAEADANKVWGTEAFRALSLRRYAKRLIVELRELEEASKKAFAEVAREQLAKIPPGEGIDDGPRGMDDGPYGLDR